MPGNPGISAARYPASDETATELDHLAFGCLPWAELSDRERRLAAAGIISIPAAPASSIPGVAVVVFRDLDQH